MKIKVLALAEVLPRDFLQTPGNYYLSLTSAKIQRSQKFTVKTFGKFIGFDHEDSETSKVQPKQGVELFAVLLTFSIFSSIIIFELSCLVTALYLKSFENNLFKLDCSVS